MSDKIVVLDAIDQKILAVLARNSRIATTELAEIIKHHYPTVRNRIAKLVENNVIDYFYPMIQFTGIGIRRCFGIYLSLRDINNEEFNEIIKKFVNNPYIIKVYELEKHNIFLMLTTNFIREARDNMDFIRQACGKNLNSLIAMTPFTIAYFKKRRFFLQTEIEVPETIKTGYAKLVWKANNPFVHLTKPVRLNKTDFKILNYIKMNAGASLEDIGKEAGISNVAVDYKLKKYLKNNLITHFGIEINPEVIGYTTYLLFLRMGGNTKAKEELIEYLKKEVKAAYHYYEYIEHWELVITFCVKNREEIEIIKEDIMKRFGQYIKDNEVLWVKKTYKNEPYPNIELVYPKD